MPASALMKSKVISCERWPLCTLSRFLLSLRQDDAGLPGATKADQPTASDQPGQFSPSGEDPGANPASMSHSPPCCVGSEGRGEGAGYDVACGGVVVTVGATMEDAIGGKV